MFKPERPIKTKTEDILKRARFTILLGDAISHWHENGSLVIGLYDKWGAGKSSVLNLLCERLGEIPEKEKPTIVHFNPWMVSGQDQLLTPFFGQIAAELEIQNREKSDHRYCR
jgi:predicted KAP-like P-loop ATPase